jgi:serine/threonine protein kinase/WD40 repeat protein
MGPEEILDNAVALPSVAERAAYLDSACGNDAALRALVEGLLQSHDAAGGFLERPLFEPSLTLDQVSSLEAPAAVIGPYKVLQQIGEGGMGHVWMAEQLQPVQRKVALKIIKPGMDSRQVLARFEAERQALALMDHPNIARVLEAGTTPGGRPYFVMELVKGVPITRFCDERRLTPTERLELLIPVCQAVQHAHQKGIIHRDLKPSNVLVCLYDGKPVPKVIDFGVAKATGPKLTERTLFTEFGQVVGTLEYMSPEQAELNQLDIDTRSDIYSLGVLLYELLTGTTPLEKKRLKEATVLEALRLIREEEPPRPSTRLSTTAELPSVAANRGLEPGKLSRLLRGELDWVIMKCLEKDRKRRYETANGLARDIERYLHDEPVQACPPSAGYRFRKFARRYRRPLVAAALLFLTALAGTAISTLLAIRAMQAEGLAAQRLEAEAAARQNADNAFGQAQRRLFDAKLAEARASRLSRRVGQRFDSLEALREAVQLAKSLQMGSDQLYQLRTEAIACLALPDLRPVQNEWEGWPAGSSGEIGWDVNLEHYARSDGEGNISVRRVADDKQLALLPGPKNYGAHLMKFSPDGVLLAVRYWKRLPGTSTNFQLWDWRRQQLLYQAARFVWPLTFTPDGRSLLLGNDDRTVTMHESATGRERQQWQVGFVPCSLAVDPGGSRLAMSGFGQRDVVVHDLASGELVVKLRYQEASLGQLPWHPDGVLLAAGCEDHRVCLWDVRTGRQQRVLQGHQNNGIRVAFHGSGGLLLSSAWDETARLWNPWTGRQLFSFAASDCRFAAGDARLAIQNGSKLSLWELALGEEYRTLMAPGNAYPKGSGDISADGRWLVHTTHDGVQVWDLALVRLCGILPCGVSEGAVFHPKKQELFTTSQNALCRWPYHIEGDALRIGPAENLLTSPGLRRLAIGAQGRVLAVADHRGPRIVHLDSPAKEPLQCDHPGNSGLAVSPDEQWVASNQYHGYGTMVWNAQTAKLVTKVLPQAQCDPAVFSPDGQWLVTRSSKEFCFWQVGSWQCVRRIPRERDGHVTGPLAFSPHQELLALAMSRDVVRLIHPATGRDLATLRVPDADVIGHLWFAPDCGQLVARTAGPERLQVWDLRLIRRQLKDRGLDWDLPALPPAPDPRALTPLRLEVD